MIRILDTNEKMNIASLYEAVFDEDGELYRQYFYDKVLPVSQVMAFGEAKIKGMLCMIPKNITVGKNEVKCSYIYGVATDVSSRRQGIMDKIMRSSLRFLEKDCFTYLIPSSDDNAKIYTKYGFGFVMDKTPELRSLPKDISVRQAGYEDIDKLVSFAKKCVADMYEIYLTKDRKYFEEAFEKIKTENGFINVYEKACEIVGYRIGFDDEAIEIVFDKEIEASAAFEKIKSPYVMARILDIKRMLALFDGPGFAGGEKGEIVIRIDDPAIEENNGDFIWKFDGCRQSFEKIKDDANEPDICLGIGELTAHIFGYRYIDKLPVLQNKGGLFINDYL